MVIFDRKILKPDMTIGKVPGTFYGLSDNRWMNADLFEEWLKNHFLVHAPPARPLLLLLDGHSSHYQPELLQIAAAERVVPFCLPPHTTHLLQPLDSGVLGSIKCSWNEACHLFCSNNPGQVVNRYNFSQIFNMAWKKSMSMVNVVSSFQAVVVFSDQLFCHNCMVVTKSPLAIHLSHFSSHLLQPPQHHNNNSLIHSIKATVP